VKILLYPILFGFRKSVAFGRVSRLRPFIVLCEQKVDEFEYGT